MAGKNILLFRFSSDRLTQADPLGILVMKLSDRLRNAVYPSLVEEWISELLKPAVERLKEGTLVSTDDFTTGYGSDPDMLFVSGKDAESKVARTPTFSLDEKIEKNLALLQRALEALSDGGTKVENGAPEGPWALELPSTRGTLRVSPDGRRLAFERKGASTV